MSTITRPGSLAWSLVRSARWTCATGPNSLPPLGLQSDTAHCQSQNFHPTKKFVRGNESRAHNMAPIELAGRSGGAMTVSFMHRKKEETDIIS
jgi:hypothetical protein